MDAGVVPVGDTTNICTISCPWRRRANVQMIPQHQTHGCSPWYLFILMELLWNNTTCVCGSIDRRCWCHAGAFQSAKKCCPIRNTSVQSSRLSYTKDMWKSIMNQGKQKLKEAFLFSFLRVNHNKRGVVCKSAVLGCFRWILMQD